MHLIAGYVDFRLLLVINERLCVHTIHWFGGLFIVLLIDHIIVRKDEIIIKHIVPTDDNCRLLPGRRFARIDTDLKKVGRG